MLGFSWRAKAEIICIALKERGCLLYKRDKWDLEGEWIKLLQMWWEHDKVLESFAVASGIRDTENWLPENNKMLHSWYFKAWRRWRITCYMLIVFWGLQETMLCAWDSPFKDWRIRIWLTIQRGFMMPTWLLLVVFGGLATGVVLAMVIGFQMLEKSAMQ